MLLILLILIFIRPFISSLTFLVWPYENLVYSILLFSFLIIWIKIKGIRLDEIKPIRLPLILFILALFISLIFSQDKITSIKELYKYIIAVLAFLVAISLSYKEKTLLIQSIVLAGLLISLLAIYQYFFGFQHISNYIAKYSISDPFILDYVSRKRVFFPFVTPNTLGGYLAIVILLSLTQKDKTWFIIPLSFALLLTKSIGALLSIFLALPIYFYLQGKLGKRKIFFLFGLLIIIGLIFMSRTITQKQHTQPFFSTVMRLNYWQDALIIIKAYPFTGVGLGNFNLIYSRYAHNSYLQIWAEMGILGIVSILWLIFVIFKSSLANLKTTTYKNQIISLISANAIFLIHNFIDFTFFLPEVALIWWVILGLILS